ncbi:MAG: DUF1987 domain-containing protein [Anaerotignaceae bacterium]
MGFVFEKKKTGSTPYILFDEENGYMKFEGESFHENVIEFYSEINSFLSKYMYTDFKTFTFDCELTYFNSSTAKLLLNMLMSMDEAVINCENKITVNWITTEDNDIIIECGEDFSEEVENIVFNMILK